jgi:ubiquinone/menaquinone biosynthesis C-methylase UbiE
MWDKGWDKIFSNNEWGKYPGEELIRFIARNYYGVPNRSEVNILEVGCGVGANLWYLAREGFNTFGLDGSQTALNKAIALMKNNRLMADIKQGDAMKLPYPDSFFDSVIDIECIYANSLDDTSIILSEIHRVLKPRGMIFSKTFATGMSGEDTGISLIDEPNTFIEMLDGPLRDDYGFIRLTPENEIAKIYHLFKDLQYDSVTRSDKNRSNVITEWVIQGIK